MAKKLRLVKAYPNRWSEGKVHIAMFQSGTRYPNTDCNPNGVHGDYGSDQDGTIEDVTCKKCLAKWGRS